jgi:outer membrane protein assembly factor BamB
LYCLDAALGTVKWSWKVQLPMDDLMWTNMLIIEGKLFIKPSHEKFLYVFDPNTGEIIQKYPTPGPGSVQMEYYNGILYYSTDSDGKLYALKLATGEWIWNHPTPNRYRYGPWRGNAQFDKVKVSPEHNCLFVGDRYFMMAIKLIQ